MGKSTKKKNKKITAPKANKESQTGNGETYLSD